MFDTLLLLTIFEIVAFTTAVVVFFHRSAKADIGFTAAVVALAAATIFMYNYAFVPSLLWTMFFWTVAVLGTLFGRRIGFPLSTRYFFLFTTAGVVVLVFFLQGMH